MNESYFRDIAANNKNSRDLLVRFLILLFCIIVVRCAWIGDDAYITFRTIDNFVNGFGLTWNIDARVQAYTSPSWMFLLSIFYFFTREIYFTSTVVSIVVSVITVGILAFKIAESKVSAALAVIVLILSKAFIDYSASGLENPLIHLLLALFFWIYFKLEMNAKTLFYLFLIASLGGLTRTDTLTIYLPVLAFSFWITKIELREKLFATFKGLLPLIIWELFSLFYYGFLFPNTAYAKLNTGLEKVELIRQGVIYLINSISIDPITLLIITIAIVTTFFIKDPKYLAVAIGLILFLLYVVNIGGDFMSGRFLTAPLFCSIALLSYCLTSIKIWDQHILIITLFLALISINPIYSPLLSNADYGKKHLYTIDANGIADERAHYFQDCGLLRADRSFKLPNHGLINEGKRDGMNPSSAKVIYNVGYYGFYAGPKLKIIDINALADPLLARLPCIKENWRIGHFIRNIPGGYFETVSTGVNQIRNKSLAAYYDKLSFVIRGNLFDLDRLKEIWNINTGKYNHFITDSFHTPLEVAYENVQIPKAEGTLWNSPGNIQFNDNGVQVDLRELYHSNLLEISLDHNDNYKIIYFQNNSELGEQIIQGSKNSTEGLAIYTVEVPEKARLDGFNNIKIIPKSGDGMYSIGHIKLLT